MGNEEQNQEGQPTTAGQLERNTQRTTMGLGQKIQQWRTKQAERRKAREQQELDEVKQEYPDINELFKKPADNNTTATEPATATATEGATGAPTSAEGTAGAAASTPEVTSNYSNEDIFKLLNPQKTPEQIVKERRREKVNEDWAKIKDALNALSEMNTSSDHHYTPQTALSEKAAARREKLEEQRQANRKAYLEGYIKARNADEDLRLKRDKNQADIKLKSLQTELAAGKIDYQYYLTQKAKIEADLEGPRIQSQISRNNRSGTTKSTTKSQKPAGSLTINGEKTEYANAADYKRAVYEMAEQYHIPITEWRNGKKVDVNINQLAAQVEAAATARTAEATGKPSPTAGKKLKPSPSRDN